MEFKNKVVMVTGATGGLGKACAMRYAQDGAKLVLLGRNMEKLKALREELKYSEENCLIFASEISDEEAMKDIAEKTVAEWKGIDVLVNTAGISGPAVLAEDYTYDDFKACYETNVYGTFLTMKYVLPIMKNQKSGAIVNTASISGIRGYELESGYGSTKWAIIGLTKDVASENPNTGVRVNCISPGWIETKMKYEILDNYAKKGGGDPSAYFSAGPMGRAGRPEEMAEGVYFLSSSKASYINGANLVIDSGSTIS